MFNMIKYKAGLRYQVQIAPRFSTLTMSKSYSSIIKNQFVSKQSNQLLKMNVTKRHLYQFSNPTTNNVNNSTQPLNDNGTNGKKSTVLRNVLMIVILGLTAVIVIQPYNPFPSPVAKELRKALWAERKQDYLKSIGHYINALSIYDQGEIKADKLSDEYTGIELKIMEMYLNLNMYKEKTRRSTMDFCLNCIAGT